MQSYGSEEQEANSVGNDKNVNLGPLSLQSSWKQEIHHL